MTLLIVRLRLAMWRTAMSRSALQLTSSILGGLAALMVLIVLGPALVLLVGQPVRITALVVPLFAGATLMWAVLSLIATGVDSILDPARFAVLPLRAPELARGLLAAALTGIPALMLVGLALAQVGAWASSAATPEPMPTPMPQTDAPRPADELSVRREGRRRRGIPLAWVAGAAAAGLVVGVAGARLLDGDDAASAPVTVASTTLDTLDTGQVKGTADVVRQDDRLDLAVRTDPIDPADGYLEVWLINEDLQRMVSIGVLRPDAPEQTFAIAQDLIDQGYVIVDISREGFDAAPQHSGDSVVRGTLAT